MRKISLFIFFLVVPVSFIEAAISYIVTVQYNGTSASVHIPDEVSGVVRCISGTSSHVLLGQSSNTNNNQDEIIYALSGNTDDGEFSLSSTDNLTLNLKGLTLKNPRGEAIHVMGKRVKVSLAADTENMLSDGNGAVVEEGCFHCDGHTEFMGKGTLTVLSNMWCAIYSKEYLTLKNCTINVIGSMKDGVYCQEYFKMSSGVLKIDNVKDNGIKIEKRISNSNSQNENSGNFYMTDGLLSIKNVGGDCIKTSGTITHSGGIFDFDTTNIKENSTETIIVPDFCKVNTGEVCAFFESPGNWTNTIHCWAWKDSPSENFTGGNWPGASCTLLGTAPNGNKVWKWIWDGKKQENSSAMQPAKIIFNNNGQPQTDDQTFTLGGYYNKYGLQGYAGESVVPSTPTDYSKQYLTFVAIEDGTFSLRRSSLLEGLFEYSIDNGSTWSTLDMNSSTPTILAGNKILWKGRSNIIVGIGTFSSTGRFNVEGNIMSLLYRDDFESATSLPDEEAFEELFCGNTNLVSAENLVLPATTLKEKCYYEMFRGCTSLIKAPKLPATHLESSCYFAMFKGCTSLLTAPELPAKSLSNYCYMQMFEGCTSLIKAPILPALNMYYRCYYNMFKGCTSLSYVKCLATNISTSECTSDWLDGVSSSGTFVKASSMNNDWSRGASGIPNGWTVSNDESVPSTPTDYSKQPFTIVAHNEDVTIRMIASSSESFEDVQFSTDKGQTWSGPGNTDLFYKVIPANTTLSLRGYFLRYLSSLEISGGTFDVEGNIASLRADYEERNKWHTYTGAINLKGLFSGHTNLISAENLVLPSTTLAQYCYQSLFEGCTSLIAAPQLPATTLAANCYNYMFAGCSSLTTAPVLPATTLASNCYSSMFEGCTSLTSVPNTLPATTLTHGCYSAMFFGCTSLTTAPVLPATSLANYCYSHMFYSCTSLTTAPELPATTLADYCYQSMFESCTSLTTAPVLPATTLANSCYKGMFQGCTSLNYIKCLATDVSATYCTTYWLYNVSSTGTFVKNASMNDWASGTSSIPNGWTVTNAQTNQTKRTIHVATAGTLPNLISEDEKYQIEELTLTGELNGTDFRFIRDLAGGGIDLDNLWKPVYTDGQLKRLDISDVSIKKGGTFYYYKIVGDNEECYTKDNTLTPFLFGGCRTLSEVRLPNTVTSIDEYAFYECNSLGTVTIPNKVEYISNIAFSYISALSVIKVDEGNRVYDSRNNCNAIINTASNELYIGCKNTTIPNNVTSIGEQAFRGCTGLKSITIPNSVTSIGERAFCNCTGLASITIPNSVTSIAYMAFYGCSSLTSVTIPNSVTDIGDNAFNGCSSLTSVTIPNSVTSIGEAFSGCSGLTSIKVESGNQMYDSRNNCNAIIETSSNTLIAGCKNTIIPNSVTSIGDNAFDGCSGLTSVTIPSSVTSIGSSAFSECSGLTSITIPSSVTSIGNHAFYQCTGLTTITIPNSVTSIGNYAFSGTAWYNNQPDGLLYAGKVAYEYKGGMPANTHITIKDGTLGIAVSAFLYCSGLTSITIPNSVKSIGSSAFYGCSGLTSVTIPNSVTSIGSYAFFDCSGLTSITIPNSVKSIGSSAFWKCSGLTSVTISNSVTSIGSYAFSGCSSLTKVVSKIMEPFKIDSFTFPSDIYSNAELVVPAGTKSLYEATDGWNKFSKITEHLLTLETQPAQPTSTTKARLIALANEEDDDQHFGFEWLRYGAPESMQPNKVYAPLYNGQIVGTLSGLNPDIYYNYRPFYKSDSGEMVYGEWVTFLTGDANVFFEPEVHTKDAIVSYDGALLSAVFVEGTEDIQEKGFEYWPKNSNARAVSLTRGDNIGSVIVSGNNTSVTIEGLKAGTEYGYRPYVKTASGITYGEEKTFKTLMLGDVNGDNKVDNYDLSDLVSYIMGIIPPHFNKDAADLNNDKKVNAADIVKMVNILK